MKPTILSLLFFLSASILLHAQRPATPFLGDDAPEWARMLAADNPNVFEVQKAYAQYYRERPFEKNTYTQFYKRWMHWARPYVQADGHVHLPTTEEQAMLEKQLNAFRNTGAGRKSAAAN
ncbi:MAG TPA: hypothetical protein PKL15_03690, partial [Saprospiraceae bacterium]|nr:hypothetical protein [Saprospiraceae bacterium]